MKLFILIYSLCFASELLAIDQKKLSVGQQISIKLPNIVKISIPAPEIADVQIVQTSGKIILTGISKGETDITFWNEAGQTFTYHLKVTHPDRNIDLKTLQEITKDIEGISIQSQAGSLIVNGSLLKSEDLTLLLRIGRAYPSVFINCGLSVRSRDSVLKILNQQLQDARHMGVRLYFKQNVLWLTGPTKSEQEAHEIEQIALSFYPLIENLLYDAPPKSSQLFLDLQFLEVRKNNATQLGISYPSEISANGSLTYSNGRVGSGFQLSPNVGLSVRALTEKGLAKVLSNPKILCKDGQKTIFSAGGEIPIRLLSERTASVQFKEYGIKILATPQIKQDEVSIQLDIRVSDLDSSTSIDGIPGILQHQLQTIASAKYGETVVLGGLLENRIRKNVQKVPFFGQLPILGELFKSRAFQNNDSELLLTITPLTSSSQEKHHIDLLKNVVRIKQMKKEFSFSLRD